MKVESLAENQYSDLVPTWETLKSVVIDILKVKIDSTMLSEDIYGRVKDYGSIKLKIDRNDLSPTDEINDMCGIRIICLFLSDLYKICTIIEDNFTVIIKDDKIADKPDESFGYLGIHYIAKIPSSYTGPHYNDLKDFEFEIQLRTIAMHAWCSVSHRLVYKNPNAVPSHMQKPFQAFSGMFYLADDYFEQLYTQSQNEQKKVDEKSIEDLAEEEINFNTLSAFLQKRFPERPDSTASSTSNLVSDLLKAGYKNISSVQIALRNIDKAINEVEKDVRGHFHRVGAVRNGLSIVNPEFTKILTNPLRHHTVDRGQYRKYIDAPSA